MPLHFERGTGHEDDCWFSGIYKITYYAEHPDNKYQPVWVAYYKPKGWKNWGNHVEKTQPYYVTFEAAKKACQRHAEASKEAPCPTKAQCIACL